MKKSFVLAFITALSVTACSSTTVKSSPAEKISDLKHICLKEAANPKLAKFVPLIADNLKARGITSEISTEVATSCQYVIAYSLNEKEGLVANAKLRLSAINNGSRTNLGESSYWFKGDEEKARVAQTGLKGQVDTLVNELLKNN